MAHDTEQTDAAAQAAIESAWREERPVLIAVASGIVGDTAAAEDVVQEAFDRLTRQRVDELDNVGAWLTVVVRRLAINHVRSGYARHEEASEAEHQDSVANGGAGDVDPADRITLDDQVQLALSVLLARLSPAERTAFLLHDVFGFSFTEIAEIVGRSPQACRQLASRARRGLHDEEPDRTVTVDPGVRSELAERFMAACSTGDVGALVDLMEPDVVGDASLLGGGLLGHVSGAENVARRGLVFFGPESGRTLLPVSVDGRPGMLGVAPGEPHVVVRLDEVDGRVHHIHTFVSPRRS